MRVVLLGAPGAGKGTQADKLAEKLQIPHLSTGELFRHNISSGTKLGLEAKGYLDAGDLVPSELTNELVDDRLSNSDADGGFILDGYPRSVQQAKALHDMLERRGVISGYEGSKPRQVLVSEADLPRVLASLESSSAVAPTPVQL